LRFYRLGADKQREYLEAVSYRITLRFHSPDGYVIEEGKGPVDGTIHYEDIAGGNLLTVHYGLPGSDCSRQDALVCVREVNELPLKIYLLHIDIGWTFSEGHPEGSYELTLEDQVFICWLFRFLTGYALFFSR
jgi:hypothetical protein